MSKEAMKLALGKIKSARDCHPNAVNTLLFEAEEILEESLEKPDFWEGYVPEPVKSGEGASATVTITLPAQQALDKKAENARELGLDYEPARDSGIVTAGGADPRTQRTWVGLTQDEITDLAEHYYEDKVVQVEEAIEMAEAKLRDRNT